MPEECEWFPGLWGWGEKARLPLSLGILGHLALPSLPLLNCTGPFLLPRHCFLLWALHLLFSGLERFFPALQTSTSPSGITL